MSRLDLYSWIKDHGLTADTLEAWGCDWQEGDVDWISFKYRGYTKTRTFLPDGGKKHYSIEPKGKPLCLFHRPWDVGHGSVGIVVEGESDAMRLFQEFPYPNERYEVYGLPGLTSWRPEMAEDLKKHDEIYFIFDNDQDYQTQKQAETTFAKIRLDLPRAKRVYLPGKVNDVCEFFRDFNIDTFIAGLQTPNYHYRAVDFTHKPKPASWLVDKVFACGDVILLSGDPGAQKSWLAMSLSQAVCDGGNDWMGFNVLESGRVLYVDEENPEDVVRDRMARLGLTNRDNMRYLLRQHVNLDKHPDKLLDEVLDFKPKLIVLDSLVAIHGGGTDENSSGGVRALYQNGIFPLARETGATVLVLHHNNKSATESPFSKVRGSGDIAGAPDSCFTVGRGERGMVRVVQFKTRRGRLTDPFNCHIVDLPDGKAEMQRVRDKF